MINRRRKSASPVCYADEPGIDPAYMWAGPSPGERVRLKRVYDPPSAEDGARVLVERLWPRGLTKDKAALTEWAKDAAPSPELRRWYGHDRARWAAFRSRYHAELAERPAAREALAQLRALAAQGPVTLVYATRDAAYSSAAVLAELLEKGA